MSSIHITLTYICSELTYSTEATIMGPMNIKLYICGKTIF